MKAATLRKVSDERDATPRPSPAYELQNILTVCHIATLAMRDGLLKQEGPPEGEALEALAGCLGRASELAWKLDL